MLARRSRNSHLSPEHWRLPIYGYQRTAILTVLLLHIDMAITHTGQRIQAPGGPHPTP